MKSKVKLRPGWIKSLYFFSEAQSRENYVRGKVVYLDVQRHEQKLEEALQLLGAVCIEFVFLFANYLFRKSRVAFRRTLHWLYRTSR